jgi:ABC-type antimicrobial peptide transport system permease subunit
VLGRTIKVNEQDATVIGIMPEDMQFALRAELWIPLTQLAGLRARPRDARILAAFGRLADGVTLSQARAELSALGSRLASEYPDANTDVTPTVLTYHERYTSSELALITSVMLGAAGFVLLIACVNVANLWLARSARRAREIALRVSLGATRWRIVRQLLVESALLAGLAGLVGLALSIVGVHLIRTTFANVPSPFLGSVHDG